MIKSLLLAAGGAGTASGGVNPPNVSTLSTVWTSPSTTVGKNLAILWTGQRYILQQDGTTFFTSTTGDDFSTSMTLTGVTGSVTSIVSNGNGTVFCVTSDLGSPATYKYFISTDHGLNFTQKHSTSNRGYRAWLINGAFIVTGDYDYPKYSTDNGSTWNTITLEPPTGTWGVGCEVHGVAYGGGTWMFLVNSGNADNVAWAFTSTTLSGTFTPVGNLSGVFTNSSSGMFMNYSSLTYFNNKFVAFVTTNTSASSVVYNAATKILSEVYSTNGASWTMGRQLWSASGLSNTSGTANYPSGVMIMSGGTAGIFLSTRPSSTSCSIQFLNATNFGTATQKKGFSTTLTYTGQQIFKDHLLSSQICWNDTAKTLHVLFHNDVTQSGYVSFQATLYKLS